jgi:hypothetical protein
LAWISSWRNDRGDYEDENEVDRGKRTKEKGKRLGSDLILGSFTLDSIQHGLVGRLAEPALQTGLFIIGESGAEPLGTIVEGIAKGLMDTLYSITASHKDL